MALEAGFNLSDRLTAHRNSTMGLQDSKTFEEYFGLVVRKPEVAQLSHARIFSMINYAGVETDDKGKRTYNFFKDEVFGIDDTLDQLYDYFSSSAKRLEVRKRILLLMGPVGGGKSTIVSTLKKGLERFSQTEAGEMYGIRGCPMNEEPLHLVPDELRPEIKKELGIHIEGDLCPHCRLELREKYDGKAETVMVDRLILSEKDRRGIGTFAPSDPKSQDITELTGSINLATIGEYGSESDPRAYRFDGELNVANRGLMEFIEMLKCDEKFLYGLLTLSQEQNIKTGRFAMIYADEVVMSHTNEEEFKIFTGNRRSEALQDRLIVAKVPYNLRMSDEVRIYQKLLQQSNLKLGVDLAAGQYHIAPQTLETAATFAVLSRLEDSKIAGMTLMRKLKLYDGEDVEDTNQIEVKDLHEEAAREGMGGVSPRYVINRLSNALVQEGVKCVNPIDAIRSLRDGLDNLTGAPDDEKKKYLKLLGDTRVAYDQRAKQEVQRAFVYAYEDSAKTLADTYLDNAEAFCNKRKIEDPITGEKVEPDEKLMRSIEEMADINENAKKGFREEVLIRISTLARKNQPFDYKSHDKLRKGIEMKLFAELGDSLKLVVTTKTPDADQQKRINEVTERLIKENGYCAHCASELLVYVGTLLNR